MDLGRRNDESALQHHKRLVYGKLEDKTLADIDYSELSDYVYGQHYSSDVARRMLYGSKRTLDILENEKVSNTCSDSPTLMSELDEKMIELRKERQKFYDQRNAFNKVVRDRSRQEELNEILINSIRDGNLPQLNYERVYVEPSNNDILVSLNDIHYGIDIANNWNIYNPDVCREMMCEYLNKVLDIAKTHHSENCIVYNCGDSISGNIHLTIRVSNKENVIEQVKGVSELISEFLAALSPYFKSVKYISVAGNHSRLDTKENSSYDERMDDLIEWYLQARLQSFDNVEICTECKLDPSIFMINIRGKNYVGVHGDYDDSTSKISALQAMVQTPVYAVLLGHKHHNQCDEIQGIKTLMAGSFLGIDDYCVQKRIYGKPEQMVCICDNTGVVCHYDVLL